MGCLWDLIVLPFKLILLPFKLIVEAIEGWEYLTGRRKLHILPWWMRARHHSRRRRPPVKRS